MAMQMREERPGHRSSGSDGNPDYGETQCLPMWDKGSTDTMAHCPVLLLWKMEWREMAGVRPAAGSVLRKLYSRRGPLICVEQATFVLYLHSCGIGWNELWTVLNYFGLQRGWWGGGPRCKWNPRSLEPQKPEFVSVLSWKRQGVSANMESQGESVPGLSKGIKASWREKEDRIQSRALQVFTLTLCLLLCKTIEADGIECMQFTQLWLIPQRESCSDKHKEEIEPISWD